MIPPRGGDSQASTGTAGSSGRYAIGGLAALAGAARMTEFASLLSQENYVRPRYAVTSMLTSAPKGKAASGVLRAGYGGWKTFE